MNVASPTGPGLGPALRATGILAILRTVRAEPLDQVCDALIEAGVRCLELTTNTPNAFGAVRRLVARAGTGIEIGMGTVRLPDQVDRAVDAGASFVVAPGINSGVGERAEALGVAWFPGALSPTEIERAWALGATAVKVFPARAAGGPGYLREVRGPLDEIDMIPTGGVRIDQVAAYRAAGAVAVGLSTQLIGPLPTQDRLGPDYLAGLVTRARRALAEFRSEAS